MQRLLLGIALLTGGTAAGAEPGAEPRLIVKPDAFRTLVNPNCSHCVDEAKRRAGELRDGDRVLCWIRGYSDGGGIPYRFFLNPYRVISDSYGVFVYDPDAGYARGYRPSYQFTFHGWRNGVMVMKHRDGTLYSCLSGVAFAGPRKGDRLQAVPTLVSDWGHWLKTYPNAVAYHMFDKYQPVELPAAPHADSVATRGPADPRLPAEAEVLGVWDGQRARAYPLDRLGSERLVEEKAAGTHTLILRNPATRTATAFRPEAAPPRKYTAPRPDKNGESPLPNEDAAARRPVTLSVGAGVPEAPFVDRETGSRWDYTGRAVQGALKGWTLVWLDSTQVKWFAWAADYPDTSVYGK